MIPFLYVLIIGKVLEIKSRTVVLAAESWRKWEMSDKGYDFEVCTKPGELVYSTVDGSRFHSAMFISLQ